MTTKIERREHFIPACVSNQSNVNATFFRILARARTDFLSRPFLSTTPPPAREVVLVVDKTEYTHLLSSSLENVFGFIFDGDVFLDGRNVRADFLVNTEGVTNRLLASNRRIKHYGMRMMFLLGGLEERDAALVFSQLESWCMHLSRRNGISFTLDAIDDPENLQVFLRSEFFKIVHGDIRAQFAAADDIAKAFGI